MKKNVFISILFLFLMLNQEAFATISSFKTYTPTYPYNNFNNYNRHYFPSNINHPYYKDRFWRRRNYYNSNNYNYPYTYYPQRRSVFSSIGDFFSRGKMTGYTDSNFTDIPYGYQQNFQNPEEYYLQNNYDIQSGATVRILD